MLTKSLTMFSAAAPDREGPAENPSRDVILKWTTWAWARISDHRRERARRPAPAPSFLAPSSDRTQGRGSYKEENDMKLLTDPGEQELELDAI